MKNVLISLIACCMMSIGAYAAPPPNGSIAVGTDNLTRVVWLLPGTNFAVDTYNGSGALVVAGASYSYAGSDAPKIAINNGTTFVGFFNPTTWQYGSWWLNSANDIAASSGLQTANYTQLGYAPGVAAGSPSWYGFSADSIGDGLFGIEWPLSPGMFGYGEVGGGTFESKYGGPVYDYQQQGATLGLTSSLSGGGFMYLFLNDNYDTSVECPVFNENLLYFYPIAGYLPVAVTSTGNRHVQVLWEHVALNGAATIEFSDWNPTTNATSMTSPIALGSWSIVSAAACTQGGDNIVRILMDENGNWFLMTVNPISGATGGATI